MLVGRILNLQRMSVHDGPGIRTTVFLKGCPLSCAWCHNPESQRSEVESAYFRGRCAMCGLCVKACPAQALRQTDGGIVRDESRCRRCFRCVGSCPYRAWERYGEEYSPASLAEELMRDAAYFQASGGGVTFSGGEPLLQSEFVAACETLLHQRGIHTAVETAAFGSREALRRLAAHTDLFMVDIKAADDEMHRRMTGVPLSPILSNILLLGEMGADVLIRIPVVRFCNDSAEAMETIAAFLREQTPYRRVELLRMHRLAEAKYQALGRDYPVKDLEPPAEQKMQALAKLLRQCGMEVLYQGETG